MTNFLDYFVEEPEDWNPLDDLLVDLPQDPILKKTYKDYYDSMEHKEIPEYES